MVWYVIHYVVLRVDL